MADAESFNIHVAPETLIRRDSGSINGHIWITIGDWAFPSVAWDDFPVVILGWWIEALLAISSGESEGGRCNFMDGPYWFELLGPEDGVTTVRSHRYSKTGSELLHEQRCKLSAVIGAVLSAARTIINVCHELKWGSPDLDNLVDLYSNLQSVSDSPIAG